MVSGDVKQHWNEQLSLITDDQLIYPFPIGQSQLETDSWKLSNIQNWSQKMSPVNQYHNYQTVPQIFIKWQSKQWVTSLPSSNVNIRMENSFSKVHAFQSLFHDIIWKQIFKSVLKTPYMDKKLKKIIMENSNNKTTSHWQKSNKVVWKNSNNRKTSKYCKKSAPRK